MNKNNQKVVKPIRKSGSTIRLLAQLAVSLVLMSLVGCSSATEVSSTKADPAPTGSSSGMSNVVSSGVESSVSNRFVVRNAELKIRVVDAEKTEKDVSRYVRAIGGYVSQSESSNLTETSPSIKMSLRVPVQKFDISVDDLEKLGTKLEKKTSGEDVTAKVVDYDARLKTMQAQEESFRTMLRASGRSTEALDLQTRLMKLREDIESIQAQRKALSDVATLSTIDLTLVGQARHATVAEDQNWLAESWNSSTSLFAVIGRSLVSLGVFVAVFSPLWAPFVLLVGWLVWKDRRKVQSNV